MGSNVVLKFVSFFICVFLLVNGSECHRNDVVDKYFNPRSAVLDGYVLMNYIRDHVGNFSTKIEVQCGTDLNAVFEGFQQQEIWALDMIDSAGKGPYAVLTGNWNSFGHRDQCVAVRHEKPAGDDLIRGKYCSVQLPLLQEIQDIIVKKYGFRVNPNPDMESFDPEVSARTVNTMNRTYIYNLGLCFPHTCSAQSVELIMQDIWDGFFHEGTVRVPENVCDTGDEKEWETVEIVVLVIFVCYGVMVLMSTGYDIWFLMYRKNKDSEDKKEVLRSFSLYTNAQKLTKIGDNPGPLGCLHGIRALSILWIVLGHRYNHRQWMPMENYFKLYTWGETFDGMIVLGATIAVDSFFVMSGMLLAYVIFRAKNADGFFKTLPMFYIHRYIRLTPIVGFVVLFYAGLSGRMFFGPMKNYLTRIMQDYCRINWWTNLLYVQNYVDTDRICVSQTWYLSIDTQLYFISPLFLYPLLKKPKIGVALMAFWILASQALTFYFAWDGKYYGGILKSTAQPHFRADFYVPTYTRATPWLIGLIVGYFLKRHLDGQKGKEEVVLTPKQVNMRRLLNVIGWIIALAIMASVLFGMQPLSLIEYEFNRGLDTSYVAFHRTAWSVALCWVVASCFMGYGGPINWFLCLKPFQFIARLSYSVYLIHKLIQSTQVSLITHVSNYDHFTMTYEFLGDIISSGCVAFVMVLVFETPVLILEKKIFHTDKPKPKPKPVEEPVQIAALEDVQVDEKRTEL